MKIIRNKNNKLSITGKIMCFIVALCIFIVTPIIIFSVINYQEKNKPNPTITASLNLNTIELTIHADRNYKELEYEYYCFDIHYEKILTNNDSIKSLTKGNDYVRKYNISPTILLKTTFVTAKIINIK